MQHFDLQFVSDLFDRGTYMIMALKRKQFTLMRQKVKAAEVNMPNNFILVHHINCR